ncbi:helix-hairpin-helix domain-containing protein [Phycicoccus avicenniae]|uniref:helix-hairpin-helix domain-containing protein n=1 Tax=Phycicoccus avicenniae TaxID=2828860 RepID=UPI003D28088F
MRDRPDPHALSPRARARLRQNRGRGDRPGWVPRSPSSVDVPVEVEEDLPVEVAADVGGGAGMGVGGRRPGRVRLPVSLATARWQPGRAAVLGVALVTVLAVLVLGLRVAWARSDDGDVVAPGGGARAGPTGLSAGAVGVGVPTTGPSASAGTSASPTASASGAGAVLVVHVVGRVRHPGVLRLPSGSRVTDAVEAAGGATRGADLSGLNLARVLVDGEQVRVPAPGEVVAGPGPPSGGTPAGGGGSGGGGGSAPGGPVSLNTADASALDALPGIGPVLAQRIVDWRTEHGRFTSVDELAEVSGIGEKLLAQLRPLVVP